MMLLAIRQLSYNATPIRNAMTNSPNQICVMRHADSLDVLVREVAQRSASVTRSRLHLDADQLSVDELRGYVRARAIAPVRWLTHELATERKISGRSNGSIGGASARTHGPCRPSRNIAADRDRTACLSAAACGRLAESFPGSSGRVAIDGVRDVGA